MTIETLDDPRRRNLIAARSVSRLLLPAEETIDRSIAACSALLEQMARSRVELNLPVGAGQSAMRAACTSVSALIDARDGMVDCHAQLVDVRDKLTLDGSDVGCTPSSPGARRRESLRRVS